MTGSELICCLGAICILCGLGCVFYSRAYCLRMFCDFETEQAVDFDNFQNKTMQQIEGMKEEIESLKDQIRQQTKAQQSKNQVVERLIDVINNFKDEPVEADFDGDTQVEDFDEVELAEDDNESVDTQTANG